MSIMEKKSILAKKIIITQSDLCLWGWSLNSSVSRPFFPFFLKAVSSHERVFLLFDPIYHLYIRRTHTHTRGRIIVVIFSKRYGPFTGVRVSVICKWTEKQREPVGIFFLVRPGMVSRCVDGGNPRSENKRVRTCPAEVKRAPPTSTLDGCSDVK